MYNPDGHALMGAHVSMHSWMLNREENDSSHAPVVSVPQNGKIVEDPLSRETGVAAIFVVAENVDEVVDSLF